MSAEPPRCPVCQARFRGAVECSRCGADLRPLMGLLLHAARLRSRTRRRLLAGDAPGALEDATAAQRLAGTDAGRRLALLARWLESRPAGQR